MTRDKIEKKISLKKTSQLRLIQLICDPRYGTWIIPQKEKRSESQNSMPNKSMLNEKK
jgi:hypothetical protein